MMGVWELVDKFDVVRFPRLPLPVILQNAIEHTIGIVSFAAIKIHLLRNS
jgi:hypothetical protein